jgi:hypothetical protein
MRIYLAWTIYDYEGGSVVYAGTDLPAARKAIEDEKKSVTCGDEVKIEIWEDGKVIETIDEERLR